MAESIGLLNQRTFFMYHGFESHPFHFMKFFYDSLDDKRKALFILVCLSLLNFCYFLWIRDLEILMLRQAFIFFIVGIRYFFGENLRKISEEDDYIRRVLEKKYPILKAERFLIWALIPSLYIMVNMIFFKYTLLCTTAYIVILVYLVVVLYSVYAIYETPEIREYYNVMKSIKKTGIRSFSTLSKTVHFCKLCIKGGAIGTVGFYGGPKLFYGPDYRSSLVSWLTYPMNGFKTNSEIDLTLGRYLTEIYPEDKKLITGADGVTIIRSKLLNQCKVRALPFAGRWL